MIIKYYVLCTLCQHKFIFRISLLFAGIVFTFAEYLCYGIFGGTMRSTSAAICFHF